MYKETSFLSKILLVSLWPSDYELQLSLERLQVLILVKVIGGQQEGHPVQKTLTAPPKSQLTIVHHPSPVKMGVCDVKPHHPHLNSFSKMFSSRLKTWLLN